MDLADQVQKKIFGPNGGKVQVMVMVKSHAMIFFVSARYLIFVLKFD